MGWGWELAYAPTVSVLLCRAGWIVVFYVFTEVAEFVMIVHPHTKPRLPPPTNVQ